MCRVLRYSFKHSRTSAMSQEWHQPWTLLSAVQGWLSILGSQLFLDRLGSNHYPLNLHISTASLIVPRLQTGSSAVPNGRLSPSRWHLNFVNFQMSSSWWSIVWAQWSEPLCVSSSGHPPGVVAHPRIDECCNAILACKWALRLFQYHLTHFFFHWL